MIESHYTPSGDCRHLMCGTNADGHRWCFMCDAVLGTVTPSEPTQLEWRPVTMHNRLGELHTVGGTFLGTMTLQEAGEEFLNHFIRVQRSNLICMRHPACDLSHQLCEPEVVS